jgi:hypothetical protein
VTAAGDFCRFTTRGNERLLFCHNEVTDNSRNKREGSVDPKIPQVRLYTVVVTGTDPVAFPARSTFAVLPKNFNYAHFEIAICQAFEKRVVY